MNLAFIVLNWNTPSYTKECIENLVDQNFLFSYQIIVIDNDSDAPFTGEGFARSPQVRIHRNQLNKGFAGGVNDGIRAALQNRPDYLVLINSDARIDKKSAQLCLDYLKKHPDIGLLNPWITRPDGSVWFAGGVLEWKKLGNYQIQDPHLKKMAKVPDLYPTDYCTGACLFIRRKVIDQVGFFDESLFAYWEDADYSVRTRRNGFQTMVLSAARAVHGVSQSSGGILSELKYYYLVRNQLYFFSKYLAGWQFLGGFPFFLLRRGKHFVKHLYLGNWKISRAILFGLLAFLGREKGKGRLGFMKNYR